MAKDINRIFEITWRGCKTKWLHLCNKVCCFA